MKTWKPSPEQSQQFENDGYFVERGVLPRDVAMEIRGVIRNTILAPDPGNTVGASADPMDPMDPMGNSPEAKAARFRKLGMLGVSSPLIWDALYTGEPIVAIMRHFLGDDLLLKFNSCFLKPARTGSATPWHQDNGLWRDGETEPMNFWMAIDPATRANGCMQFIPGSHRTEIVTHVEYEGGVHSELPRDRVEAMKASHGFHHIELEPGDAVFWHSSLWHFSPPNPSDHSRIGIAGVYTTPEIVAASTRFKRFQWVMRSGRRCTAFPPDTLILGDGQAVDLGPSPAAETLPPFNPR